MDAAGQRTVIIKHHGLRSVGAFAAFPTKIIRNTALSLGGRLTYALLLSYAWQEDFCFPAQESLAKDLGVTDRHVRRFLSELRDKGLVSWKQQGLNRPNVYYILEIEPSKPGTPPSDPENSNEDEDRTSVSGPERTLMSGPGRTSSSAQERTPASDYKQSIKKKHEVVNRSAQPEPATKTDNDHVNRSGKQIRKGQGRPTISDAALRSKYGFSDDQLSRVHYLIEKQVEILGAEHRNLANYIKRAAEAVADANTELLDYKLSDFKQASREIAIGSKPAYFHRMYEEAMRQRSAEQAVRAATAPPVRSVPVAEPAAPPPAPGGSGPLFTTRPEVKPTETEEQTRQRFLAAAEREGLAIPEWVRGVAVAELKSWYGQAVIEAARKA